MAKKSKYIQSVVDAAKGRPKSTDWYRAKIKEFGEPGAMDLIRDGKRNNRPFYGRLNMFFYDPKYKKKLPYYDTFPLVLPIERYPDGFLGINFHYWINWLIIVIILVLMKVQDLQLIIVNLKR